MYTMLGITSLIFLIRISVGHKTLAKTIFIFKMFFNVNSQVIHNKKINTQDTPGIPVCL